MIAARAAFLALLLCFSFAAAADVAVPPLTGRVVDQTGTLSSADIAVLTQTLTDLEARKGSQIAVLVVPTTDRESIEQFSLRVAEAWKIGRKKIDDGALLVVAKDDRRLRIEVGYGLEGALTDATTRRIIDEDITPKFKSGDFAGGISAGVNRMIRVIDGEKLPAPEPEHWRGPGLLNSIDPFNPFVIAAVFIVGGILRSTLGRLFGAAATGGFVGFVAWLFVGSIAASTVVGVLAFLFTLFGDMMPMGGGRGRGGAWSGGGGSGSSGGGFSGGGGSFGGGGASGRW
ncbi:YgcG family protein [Bradyrhizobium sp.]|uniref:TPM domain-containing protein n=1 Tax=Bradyrhizobium sp. TaxID=376 RepID=UPI000A490BE6|nr:YgcG family protein [Bradyrhizobium sp.]